MLFSNLTWTSFLPRTEINTLTNTTLSTAKTVLKLLHRHSIVWCQWAWVILIGYTLATKQWQQLSNQLATHLLRCEQRLYLVLKLYWWINAPVKLKNSPSEPSIISGVAALIITIKPVFQGTLQQEDTLWAGYIFSEQYPIFPMLRNMWWRDSCHVGPLSLGYWGVPWRQILL